MDDEPRGGSDAALLIDWENLKFSLQQREMRPNVSAIRDTAERFGRVVVARAYADWQDGWHRGDPTNLYAAGIEPIYVPTRSYWEGPETEKRKNSVDVKLTADCIELCHNFSTLGVFVLVTGDQDFLHVVNTLRPYGKRVVIVGVSWTTSARLAERVDSVIYYDRDVARVPGADESTSTPTIGGAVDPKPTLLDAAVQRVIRMAPVDDDLVPELRSAMERIVATVTEYRGRSQELLLSQLGMELSRTIKPQFYSMVVKGKLKQLVEALQSERLIKVVTRGLVDWLYLPEELVVEAEDQGSATTTTLFTEHFVELPASQRNEIVGAIRTLRAQPNISYLTFNRICDELVGTSVGRALGGYTRRLVEGMIEAGVLTRTKQLPWFDAPSGRTGLFWVYELNEAHDRVRDCS